MERQTALCTAGLVFLLLMCRVHLSLARSEISCDFDDDDCGFSQDEDSPFRWVRAANDSDPQDRYMLVEKLRPKTPLTSPVYNIVNTLCVHFRYRFHDNDTDTQLHAYIVMEGPPSSEERKWSDRGASERTTDWQSASFTTSGGDDPFRLKIEADGETEVDIDDVFMDPHITCFSGRLSCDFNDDLCGHVIEGEGISHSSTIPTSSFDLKGRTGSFIAFQPDPSVSTYSASLAATMETLYNSFPWCLQFWYFMYGPDVATLAVDIGETTVWSVSGSVGRHWRHVQVNMSSNGYVQFRFDVGNGTNAVMAVDDVSSYAEECKPRQADCDFETDLCDYTVSTDSGNWEREIEDLENVALWKPVDHSEGWSEPDRMDRLVDGVYSANGSQDCALTLFPHNVNGGHWIRIDLLDSYDVEELVLYTRNDCCETDFKNVLVYVSNHTSDVSVFAGDYCGLHSGPTTLGMNVTLLCVWEQKERYVWLWKTIGRQFDICDVDIIVPTNHHIRRRVVLPQNATAVLESPLLTGDPAFLCLRFSYVMKVDDIGTLLVYTETTGGNRTLVFETSNYTDVLTTAELDLAFTKPVKVVFEAVAYLSATNNVTAANLELHSFSVDRHTCNPVPWAYDWTFSCDRPTTPCSSDGTCVGGRCECGQGFEGQQCHLPTASFTCTGPDPCVHGQCYDKGSSQLGCSCDDGYYGVYCHLKMVHAECDDSMMVVNIYPYGNDVTKMAAYSPSLPETEDGRCQFLTAEVFEIANPLYIYKNWDGYIRAFLHSDPNCGDVSIVEDTDTETTYSRTFNVYYNHLGRDPTDTKVTVNCTVEKELTTTTPTPTTTTTTPTSTTAMMTTTTTPSRPPTPPLPAPYVRGVVTVVGRAWRSRFPPVQEVALQLYLSLNVPNSARMTAMKVLKCTVRDETSTAIFVNNGCAAPPIGQLVLPGPMGRAQVMLIRVFRRGASIRRLNLSFRCNVRLCHAMTDYTCFQKRSCFGRKRRSAEPDAHTSKGDNEVEVTFDFTG